MKQYRRQGHLLFKNDLSGFRSMASEAAVMYAGKKWGKHIVAMEKGHIVFQQEPERRKARKRDTEWSR